MRVSFATSDNEEIKEPPRPRVITKFGDDMTNYIWDAAENSDDEVEELKVLKTQFEIKNNVRFSKSGIKDYINNTIIEESPNNKSNIKSSKLWESSLKLPGLNMWLKKGGSSINK